MEGLKLVFLVTCEFEQQKKNKIERSSLDISDYQDSDAKRENNEYPAQNLSKSVVFWIEVSMVKIELVLTEN